MSVVYENRMKKQRFSPTSSLYTHNVNANNNSNNDDNTQRHAMPANDKRAITYKIKGEKVV